MGQLYPENGDIWSTKWGYITLTKFNGFTFITTGTPLGYIDVDYLRQHCLFVGKEKRKTNYLFIL